MVSPRFDRTTRFLCRRRASRILGSLEQTLPLLAMAATAAATLILLILYLHLEGYTLVAL